MSELTVTRWARYGKERLYVATTDGDAVGYLDVQTGRSELKRPELAEDFQSALAGHLAGTTVTAASLGPR